MYVDLLLQSGSSLSVGTSCDDKRAAGLPSPNVIRTNNRESERWYDYEDGAATVTATASPQAPTEELNRHDEGAG